MFYPYRLDTGLFTGEGFDLNPRTEEAIEAHTPEGCGLFEGQADPLCQRVDLDTGELIPHQPPAPPETEYYRHEWDGRRWQPIAKALAIAERVRADRARMLTGTDWVVTRALERAEPVPPEWLAYRQALRDLPLQPGFPEDIEWPESPAS
jgi:hypothetical protein